MVGDFDLCDTPYRRGAERTRGTWAMSLSAVDFNVTRQVFYTLMLGTEK
jgi:hypothetical protein